MRYALLIAMPLGLALAMYASAPSEAAPEADRLEVAAGPLAHDASIAPGTDPAPVPLPTPENLGEYFSALWTAAAGGAWVGLMALLVNGLMWYLRRRQGWLVARWAWLGTRGGGLALLFVLGALAEVAARLAAPPGSVPLGFMAVLVGAVAAGFNAMGKAGAAVARSTWRAAGG